MRGRAGAQWVSPRVARVMGFLLCLTVGGEGWGQVTTEGALVANLAAPTAEAPAPAPTVMSPEAALSAMRARYAGTYREVSGAANAANRDAAVRRSVAPLFFMVRGLATSRITEGNPAFPEVRIAFHGGDIELQTLPVRALSPENGDERTVRGFNGAVNRLTQTLTIGGLTQTTWTEEGSRTTHFSQSADGRRLTLHIEIRSPRLSVPVRYHMSYARAD